MHHVTQANIHSSKQHIYNHQRGAILVESALMLPLFIVMLIAIFDYGLVLAQKHAILQSMAMAGRSGVLVDSGCSSKAKSTFNTIVSRYPGLDHTVIKSVDYKNLVADTVTISGMELTVEGNYMCVLCHLTMGENDFTLSHFEPFMHGRFCS